MARHMLRSFVMVLSVASLCSLLFAGFGCVIPADIEPATSEGPWIDVDLTIPDPRDVKSYAQGQTEAVKFSVNVGEPNGQLITARVFVDAQYDAPIDPEPNSISPNPDSPNTGVGYVFSLRGLCDELVDYELGRHILELYISDNGFWDQGTDLRVVNPGGFRNNVLWRFNCVEPLPTESAESEF